MKVLIVHNYYQDPGGEDAIFHQEVEYLSEHVDVDTLTFQNKKKLLGAIQYLFYPFNIWAAIKLYMKCIKFKPNVVHIHNTHYASGPILFAVLRLLNIPSVLTAHNYRLVCPSALLLYKGKNYLGSVGKNFPWDAVKKRVLDNSLFKTFYTAFTYRFHAFLGTWKNISKIVVLTQYAKDLLLKGKLGLSKDQIIVKPNFVQAPSITYVPTPTEPFYLYIGRLSEEKGIGVLQTQMGNFKLKVIGDGPLKSQLRHPNIELLGHKKKAELTQYLIQAHALIIPSICIEGFPTTLLEALATSCPVIISQNIAASEIIIDQLNGILIDPYQCKDSLNQLIHQDLSHLGRKGRKLYEQHFTPTIIMDQLMGIYRSLDKTPL